MARSRFRRLAGAEALRDFESSPGKLRRFCGRCGTHMLAERPAEPHVVLRVATLDDDPGLRPVLHVWTTHDVPWLSEETLAPRHPEWPPGR
ncbi:GFA family protein [Siccirubricoccus sp. KC 17139]|uniref:GFA family protein n=1 Tax=Siccirubricoccus soli TaxID=2899147 RepID=A0ABT1D102_9PROT|nr:GFA family protein [Siccirubricoccus soli]MCP2681469.1 GFA family protein [Siccirubricoccus soli]